MRRLILFFAVVGIAGCADSGRPTAPSSTPSQPNFAAVGSGITDLGTLPGGDYSEALGINDRGQVAGFSNAAPLSQLHAVLWTVTPNGPTVQDLGSLAGGSGQAFGIDGGHVAGVSTTASGVGHAALWTVVSNGVTVQDLGTLGGLGSVARGSNALGQVVRFGNTVSGAPHAALWTVATSTSGHKYDDV